VSNAKRVYEFKREYLIRMSSYNKPTPVVFVYKVFTTLSKVKIIYYTCFFLHNFINFLLFWIKFMVLFNLGN